MAALLAAAALALTACAGSDDKGEPDDGGAGMLIPPSMGLATALNFQPTGNGRAAINGDFVMTAAEVQDVVQALRGGGIDIVAIHNHGFDEQPRLFYMHFWAENDAVALARTLRAAVDATAAR